MAKREKPKPLFTLKHDFVDSLDNVAQQAITFLQIVEQALELDLVKEPIKTRLRQQADQFRASLIEP